MKEPYSFRGSEIGTLVLYLTILSYEESPFFPQKNNIWKTIFTAHFLFANDENLDEYFVIFF